MKKYDKKANFKIIELHKVKRTKYGRVVKTRHDLEPHEEKTLGILASFGFDIETVIPSNIPHSKNPDIIMLGTFWEMKGPISTDEDTVQTKFRKATRQSGGKAIIDLTNVRGNVEKLEKFVIELFATTRGMRRIMIIEKNGEKILDIRK